MVRLFVAFYLTLSAGVSYAAQPTIDELQIIDSVQKRWNAEATIAKALLSLQKEMGAETYAFLAAKMKAANLLQAKPPKFEKVGTNSFTIDYGASKISFELKSLAAGTIVVNHHEVVISKNDKPADIWAKILAALPAKVSRHFNFFINEAEAAEVGDGTKKSAAEIYKQTEEDYRKTSKIEAENSSGFRKAAAANEDAAAISAGTAALYAAMANDYKCAALTFLNNRCDSNKTTVAAHALSRKKGDKYVIVADDIQYSKNAIKDITATLNNISAPSMCAEKVQAINACIEDFVTTGARFLHVDLRKELEDTSPPTTTK